MCVHQVAGRSRRRKIAHMPRIQTSGLSTTSRGTSTLRSGPSSSSPQRRNKTPASGRSDAGAETIFSRGNVQPRDRRNPARIDERQVHSRATHMPGRQHQESQQLVNLEGQALCSARPPGASPANDSATTTPAQPTMEEGIEAQATNSSRYGLPSNHRTACRSNGPCRGKTPTRPCGRRREPDRFNDALRLRQPDVRVAVVQLGFPGG